MASDEVDVSTGVTISFDDNGDFTPQLLDIDLPELSVENIRTSHQSTTGGTHTYIPSDLKEPGQLEFDCHYNPDQAAPVGDPDDIIVSFPSGASLHFAGYLQSFKATAPFEDKMTAHGIIKVNGAITHHEAGPTATPTPTPTPTP